MTPTDTKALRELLEKADLLSLKGRRTDTQFVLHCPTHKYPVAELNIWMVSDRGQNESQARARAAAIVGGMNSLPSLLTEVEELRRVRDAAEEVANFAWSSIKEIDCSEAADNLNGLLRKLRDALEGKA